MLKFSSGEFKAEEKRKLDDIDIIGYVCSHCAINYGQKRSVDFVVFEFSVAFSLSSFVLRKNCLSQIRTSKYYSKQLY